MVARSPTEGILSKLVLALAVLVGIGVAAGVATAPGEALDALVYRTGVTSFYAAAVPVGVTTRTALALLAGVLAIAVVAGPATALRWRDARRRAPLTAKLAHADVDAVDVDDEALPPPVVRRADAHPDAPPRRPIRAAAEFGMPRPIARDDAAVIEVAAPSAPIHAAPPAEAPLPRDLDQPLAAFDPAAIPAEPLSPPEPLLPLARDLPTPAPVAASADAATVTVEPEQRDDLVVIAEAAAPSIDRAPVDDGHDAPEESISALLARLERGRLARRRAAALPVITPAPTSAPPPETLDDTLARLRQLAAR